MFSWSREEDVSRRGQWSAASHGAQRTSKGRMKGGSGLAEDTAVAEPDGSAKAQGQGKPSLSRRVDVGGRREGDSGIQRGPFGIEGI